MLFLKLEDFDENIPLIEDLPFGQKLYKTVTKLIILIMLQ